jgi:hypothetical protein
MAKLSSANAAANGGILEKNLQKMKENFELVYGTEVPMDDARRTVSYGFDTTSLQDGLYTSDSTNQIIGCAFDFEAGQSLFKSALSSLADVFAGEPGGDEEGDGNDETPPTENADGDQPDRAIERAKHFFVCIATTLDKNKNPIATTVARFGLKENSSIFLKRYLDSILKALCAYGFIGVACAMDGAVENRTWAKWKVTHSIDDLVNLGMCPEQWKLDPSIPSDKKIAFLHPCFDPEDKVFVVIHPDMPHLIKKIVNALEKSTEDDAKRDMWKNGCPLSLDMLEEVWNRSRTHFGTIRTTRLGTDHFKKDCNSRMRTFLSVQVTSQSAVNLIDDVITLPDEMAEYKEFRDFLLLLDQLIDVMNARQKGHSGVDSKDHADLMHLLKCVRTCEEWRQEVKADKDSTPDNFLPMTTFEDLTWMCLGTCVLAQRYCDGNFKIDLGRCGTDCCEYRFGNLKGTYTQRLTLKDANRGTFIADNINAQAFNLKAAGNTSAKAISTAGFKEVPKK